MTDKELLELAAKAIGYTTNGETEQGLWVSANKGKTYGVWNPLTDDGDALRLAIKLDMNIYVGFKKIYAEIISDGDEPPITTAFDKSDDPYAATRLAITRAAVEIGRAMP